MDDAIFLSDGAISSSPKRKKYKFAVIPKQLSSPFFDVVHEGCVGRAKKLGNVECLYVGTDLPDSEGQAGILRNLTLSGEVDGIAISILLDGDPVIEAAIAFASDAGIPVITFDSDFPGSKRLTYIGTDNYGFGSRFGKVLLQIDPTGGYYGVITTKALNAVERERGLRDRLAGSNWIEHGTSPGDCEESDQVGVREMRRMASHPELKAIIPVGGWPMRNTTLWEQFIDEHPNLITVGADALPHQMDMLNRGYITGLVSQVPYQMGSRAMEILLAHSQGESIPEEVYGTALLEIVTVPLDLPDAHVNMHYIGSLVVLGIAISVIVTALAAGFAIWVIMHRKLHVVRASQPIFLIMIAVGTAIMGLSIIPMSFDDGTNVLKTDRRCVVACMSSIWLLSIGFTTVFSALFSKTWRINKIFHNPSVFSRVKVTAKDVMGPYLLLLSANVLTLSLFTALAPLEIVRRPHIGTDDWNRIISTFGTCQTKNERWGGATPYYVVLLLINISALVFANFQAYQARTIQSEFSESKYIAIVNAGMLQACVTTIPILFLVRELPEVSYVLKVSAIFICCIVILLCIFVPKILKSKTQDGSVRRRSSTSVVSFRRNMNPIQNAIHASPREVEYANREEGGLRVKFSTTS